MPDWFAPTLTVIGVITVGVLTFLGGRYAAKQSAKAAAQTAAVNSRQVDVSEWQAIVAELRKEISRVNERLDGVVADLARERLDRHSLIAYARSLLLWGRRVAPHETPPMPPAAFVDELAYITER